MINYSRLGMKLKGSLRTFHKKFQKVHTAWILKIKAVRVSSVK